MPSDPCETEQETKKESKGERTAKRIMDVAESLFAVYGYDGTSLRQIADGAGIKEPGLYNHFASKQALYEAVLFRALNPMVEVLATHLDDASHLRDYTDLPSIMTDLLLEHPQMAALFQQAMQGDTQSLGNQLVGEWLETLFNQGMRSLEDIGPPGAAGTPEQDRATLAINLIAMFNLTTGYFLSQRAFSTLAEGNLQDPDNIERQKRLLHKVIRAMLIS
jgi:AcrR family transcriptional regulator